MIFRDDFSDADHPHILTSRVSRQSQYDALGLITIYKKIQLAHKLKGWISRVSSWSREYALQPENL